MTWPANSPDFNCIENLWSWLDQQLAKQQLFNKDDLIKTVTHLNNVPQIIVHNFVDNMPDRLDECIGRK